MDIGAANWSEDDNGNVTAAPDGAPEGMAPGAVVQVAQKGYRRGERSLRAARVVVAREPAGPGA